VLGVTSMAVGLVVSAWASFQDQTWPALIIAALVMTAVSALVARWRLIRISPGRTWRR
jgi:hypothetical protein